MSEKLIVHRRRTIYERTSESIIFLLQMLLLTISQHPPQHKCPCIGFLIFGVSISAAACGAGVYCRLLLPCSSDASC